ncbi:MAG: hypothetical protein EZS28_055997 [Streblomastix strix]|uniref:Uncharacterized protein n=1 Tax=Streblomastix strix TaxID=222440 RepID=A0A5J4PTZ5_9EUKA|nr:MAG: hypothetical protein EZS28_055997 [Streblomastix strix]
MYVVLALGVSARTATIQRSRFGILDAPDLGQSRIDSHQLQNSVNHVYTVRFSNWFNGYASARALQVLTIDLPRSQQFLITARYFKL